MTGEKWCTAYRPDGSVHLTPEQAKALCTVIAMAEARLLDAAEKVRPGGEQWLAGRLDALDAVCLAATTRPVSAYVREPVEAAIARCEAAS